MLAWAAGECICLSIVLPSCFSEVAEEFLFAGACGVGGIVDDGLDTPGKEPAPGVAGVAREEGPVGAGACVDDVGERGAGDVVEYGLCVEAAEQGGDGGGVEAGGTGYLVFVDGDILAEEAAVEPQEGVDDGVGRGGQVVEAVELVAPEEEYKAGGVALGEEQAQVAGGLQPVEGAAEVEGKVSEAGAEGAGVEGQGERESLADGYLVVAGEVVVDLAYVVVGGVVLVDAPAEQWGVGAAPEECGPGGLAVAPGASGFLEVGFEGVGRVEMDDETYVGFVNAHSEGVGGYDDGYLSGLPKVLPGVFVGGRQNGVVVGGCVAAVVEPL